MGKVAISQKMNRRSSRRVEVGNKIRTSSSDRGYPIEG